MAVKWQASSEHFSRWYTNGGGRWSWIADFYSDATPGAIAYLQTQPDIRNLTDLPSAMVNTNPQGLPVPGLMLPSGVDSLLSGSFVTLEDTFGVFSLVSDFALGNTSYPHPAVIQRVLVNFTVDVDSELVLSGKIDIGINGASWGGSVRIAEIDPATNIEIGPVWNSALVRPTLPVIVNTVPNTGGRATMTQAIFPDNYSVLDPFNDDSGPQTSHVFHPGKTYALTVESNSPAVETETPFVAAPTAVNVTLSFSPVAPAMETKSWLLQGNTVGADSPADFLGTKDAQPLIFKTNSDALAAAAKPPPMQIDADGRVVINRVGDWYNPGNSIASESLVVAHSENGMSSGVSFQNMGGGNFVQEFKFGSDSTLPREVDGVAATIWAHWHGLVISAQESQSFVIGSFLDTGGGEPGRFTFLGGNVGVGTTTPSRALHVQSTRGDAEIGVQGATSDGRFPGNLWTIQSSGFGNDDSDLDGTFQIIDRSLGVSRFIIDRSGFVGIGVESRAPKAVLEVNVRPGLDANGLEVNGGNLRVTGDIQVTGNIICDGAMFAKPGSQSGADPNLPGYRKLYENTVPPFLDLDGDTHRCAMWSRPSDERLKREVVPIADALAAIKQLRGVTFYWNKTGLEHLTEHIPRTVRSTSGTAEDDEKLWEQERQAAYARLSKQQIGFIAQDVQRVFPEWTTTDAHGYARIDMKHLDAIFVNALNEQQTQIESLRTEMQELKEMAANRN